MKEQKIGLIIGASRDAIHTIEVAKKYGIKIVAIDGNPKAEGFGYADEYIVVDISDREKVCEIVNNIKPDFVLPIPIGRYLSMTGYVNEKYHLPGIQYEETEVSVDKYLFHKKLNQNGLRNIQLFLVNEKSDLSEIIMNYPAILKPRYGSGSRDVFYITSSKEFEAAYQKIKFQNEDFILEQAVDGVEYGIDGAVIDGKLHITLIRQKINTPLPIRQAISSLAVTDTEDNKELQKLIYGYLDKIVRVLGYKNCLINADIIVKNHEAFVIEISPRPSGHNLHNLFVPLATGIDMAEEYIKFLLGGKFSFDPQYTKCLQIRFFDFQNVIVKKIPNEDMLKNSKQCNLVYWKCNISPNETMEPVTNGKSIMGRGLFVVEGKDEANLIEQSSWILSQFKLEEK